MRQTSEYSVLCPCGVTVEFPDSTAERKCPQCGRVLVVATWPNQPLVVVEASR